LPGSGFRLFSQQEAVKQIVFEGRVERFDVMSVRRCYSLERVRLEHYGPGEPGCHGVPDQAPLMRLDALFDAKMYQ